MCAVVADFRFEIPSMPGYVARGWAKAVEERGRVFLDDWEVDRVERGGVNLEGDSFALARSRAIDAILREQISLRELMEIESVPVQCRT